MKVVSLSLITLIIVTVLIEVPGKFLVGMEHAVRYFLIGWSTRAPNKLKFVQGRLAGNAGIRCLSRSVIRIQYRGKQPNRKEVIMIEGNF